MAIGTDTAARYLVALEDTFTAHNYHPLDVVLTRGEGCWLWDVDGRRFLDCLAAYSAVNQGHCHPRLVRVMAEQAARLTLTSRAFRNDQIGPFAQELCELAGYSKALLMNSGAEAVETALKAVRKWGYKVKGVPDDRAEVIGCHGNFSGRTISIVSFSDEQQYRDGFGPFTPGFRLVPYGEPSAVEDAIGPNTVAVFMEPVQGEAGVVIPPHGALRQIREICDNHDVLLIFDEIQSGLGRTGRMFAWQHEDARPDGITLGKALSGGMMPVSAFLADDQLMEVFHPGDHGSTFGGNPLGAAVAREALRILVDEGLVENAAAMGERLGAGLDALDYPSIREIRRIGLWVGLELHPGVGGARRYCEALMRAGMLCKETHTHTLRLAPPLVIQPNEIDWLLERLHEVFRELG